MCLLHVLLVGVIAWKIFSAGKASSLLVTVDTGNVGLILGLAVALPATHVAGEGVPFLPVTVSADPCPEHCITAATFPES